jgi:hypothetical protein
MAHRQPVFTGLQLSQDAGVGGAAAVAVPGQGCARVGRPVRRKHGVAGTLGDHDVGGGASDLEDDASLRNRTGYRPFSGRLKPRV